MLRGGNWHEGAGRCRSANRCRLPPLSKGNVLGFRVLRRIDAIFLKASDESLQERREKIKGAESSSKSGAELGGDSPPSKAREQQTGTQKER